MILSFGCYPNWWTSYMENTEILFLGMWTENMPSAFPQFMHTRHTNGGETPNILRWAAEIIARCIYASNMFALRLSWGSQTFFHFGSTVLSLWLITINLLWLNGAIMEFFLHPSSSLNCSSNSVESHFFETFIIVYMYMCFTFTWWCMLRVGGLVPPVHWCWWLIFYTWQVPNFSRGSELDGFSGCAHFPMLSHLKHYAKTPFKMPKTMWSPFSDSVCCSVA